MLKYAWNIVTKLPQLAVSPMTSAGLIIKWTRNAIWNTLVFASNGAKHITGNKDKILPYENVFHNYLDWIGSIPWALFKTLNPNLNYTAANHYTGHDLKRGFWGENKRDAGPVPDPKSSKDKKGFMEKVKDFFRWSNPEQWQLGTA